MVKVLIFTLVIIGCSWDLSHGLRLAEDTKLPRVRLQERMSYKRRAHAQAPLEAETLDFVGEAKMARVTKFVEEAATKGAALATSAPELVQRVMADMGLSSESIESLAEVLRGSKEDDDDDIDDDDIDKEESKSVDGATGDATAAWIANEFEGDMWAGVHHNAKAPGMGSNLCTDDECNKWQDPEQKTSHYLCGGGDPALTWWAGNKNCKGHGAEGQAYSNFPCRDTYQGYDSHSDYNTADALDQCSPLASGTPWDPHFLQHMRGGVVRRYKWTNDAVWDLTKCETEANLQKSTFIANFGYVPWDYNTTFLNSFWADQGLLNAKIGGQKCDADGTGLSGRTTECVNQFVATPCSGKTGDALTACRRQHEWYTDQRTWYWVERAAGKFEDSFKLMMCAIAAKAYCGKKYSCDGFVTHRARGVRFVQKYEFSTVEEKKAAISAGTNDIHCGPISGDASSGRAKFISWSNGTVAIDESSVIRWCYAGNSGDTDFTSGTPDYGAIFAGIYKSSEDHGPVCEFHQRAKSKYALGDGTWSEAKLAQEAFNDVERGLKLFRNGEKKNAHTWSKLEWVDSYTCDALGAEMAGTDGVNRGALDKIATMEAGGTLVNLTLGKGPNGNWEGPIGTDWTYVYGFPGGSQQTGRGAEVPIVGCMPGEISGMVYYSPDNYRLFNHKKSPCDTSSFTKVFDYGTNGARTWKNSRFGYGSGGHDRGSTWPVFEVDNTWVPAANNGDWPGDDDWLKITNSFQGKKWVNGGKSSSPHAHKNMPEERTLIQTEYLLWGKSNFATTDFDSTLEPVDNVLWFYKLACERWNDIKNSLVSDLNMNEEIFWWETPNQQCGTTAISNQNADARDTTKTSSTFLIGDGAGKNLRDICWQKAGGEGDIMSLKRGGCTHVKKYTRQQIIDKYGRCDGIQARDLDDMKGAGQGGVFLLHKCGNGAKDIGESTYMFTRRKGLSYRHPRTYKVVSETQDKNEQAKKAFTRSARRWNMASKRAGRKAAKRARRARFGSRR